MNEHPKHLVLTPAGTLAGYVREDILRVDLATGKAIGEPAQGVWKLNDTSLGILYERTSEFDAWIGEVSEATAGPGETELADLITQKIMKVLDNSMQRLANLCPRHKRARLPRPTVAECADCGKERNQQ